jgi:hypothetical protein
MAPGAHTHKVAVASGIVLSRLNPFGPLPG